MDKVGRPRGLVLFDTLANQAAKQAKRPLAYRLIRPRVVVYAALLSVVAIAMLAALLARPTVELTVLRDRAPLYVPLSDGSIRNGFTIKVLNKTRRAREFVLAVDGLPGAVLQVVQAGAPADAATLAAEPDSVATYRVNVSVPPRTLLAESNPISFRLRDRSGAPVVAHDSVFRGPAPAR
jgi:polyferredoxin